MDSMKQSLKRSDNHGWRVIVSGDNGYELLQYIIKVDGLTEASERTKEITAIIAEYGHELSEYTQITLRSWQIEVGMSAPSELWLSADQREFATRINDQVAK